MATGQYRSAISLDDVAQKTTLARSAHQNNSERTSKPLEEQCDEFVPLVSLRFQGVNTIDVIERNRHPKNSVALEPGDLEVDFVCVFPTLLRAIFPFLRGRGGGLQESGRILFCSPIVKTKKVQIGQRFVLFSGVRILMAIVNGKLVHQYAGTPLHQYTDKAVHRYTGAPVHLQTGTGRSYYYYCV